MDEKILSMDPSKSSIDGKLLSLDESVIHGKNYFFICIKTIDDTHGHSLMLRPYPSSVILIRGCHPWMRFFHPYRD